MKNILSYFILIILLLLVGSHTKRVFAASSEGMLLRAFNAPQVYIIEKSMRRWIVDPQAFDALHLNWSLIRNVSSQQVANFPEGVAIKDGRTIPNGILYRADGQPEVYVMENDRRRWIPDPATFDAKGYRWDNIHIITPDTLAAIRKAGTVAGAASDTTGGTPIAIPRAVQFLETPNAVTERADIRFRFAADTSSLNSPPTYETLLAGFDRTWVSNGQRTTRQITLREGGDYMFYVRATMPGGSVSAEPTHYAFRANIADAYKAVRISQVAGKESNPDREYVQITNTSRNPVSLENWTLEGRRKNAVRIPPGVALPNVTAANVATPIILAPGERLTLVTGRSPFDWNAFRQNRCLGYITKPVKTTPTLPVSCPKQDAGYVENLTSVCQSYIRQLAVCTVPTNIIDTRISQDATCMAYLRGNYHYEACVRDFRWESDFYNAREWRAYLGFSQDLWDNAGDDIILRDATGAVMDRYSFR